MWRSQRTSAKQIVCYRHFGGERRSALPAGRMNNMPRQMRQCAAICEICLNSRDGKREYPPSDGGLLTDINPTNATESSQERFTRHVSSKTVRMLRNRMNAGFAPFISGPADGRRRRRMCSARRRKIDSFDKGIRRASPPCPRSWCRSRWPRGAPEAGSRDRPSHG